MSSCYEGPGVATASEWGCAACMGMGFWLVPTYGGMYGTTWEQAGCQQCDGEGSI